MAVNALEALQAFGAGRQMALQEREIHRQEQARDQQLATRARVGDLIRGGDVAGAQREAAAGGEFDWAQALGRLDDSNRERALGEAQAGGEAARALRALPADQRPAALQRFLPILRSRGFDEAEIAAYAGDLSDGTLDSLIGSADAVTRILRPVNQQQRPYRWRSNSGDLMEIGPDGQAHVVFDDPTERTQWQRVEDPETGEIRLVPVPTNPSAGAPGGGEDLPRPRTPEEARQLPPGTRFYLPDGTIGTVPGGPTPTASGNFPG